MKINEDFLYFSAENPNEKSGIAAIVIHPATWSNSTLDKWHYDQKLANILSQELWLDVYIPMLWWKFFLDNKKENELLENYTINWASEIFKKLRIFLDNQWISNVATITNSLSLEPTILWNSKAISELKNRSWKNVLVALSPVVMDSELSNKLHKLFDVDSFLEAIGMYAIENWMGDFAQYINELEEKDQKSFYDTFVWTLTNEYAGSLFIRNGKDLLMTDAFAKALRKVCSLSSKWTNFDLQFDCDNSFEKTIWWNLFHTMWDKVERQEANIICFLEKYFLDNLESPQKPSWATLIKAIEWFRRSKIFTNSKR